MECVVLWRNPRSGLVGHIADEDGEMTVFANRDAAITFVEESRLCQAFLCQVVELEEL